jgi:hypothetical protein
MPIFLVRCPGVSRWSRPTAAKRCLKRSMSFLWKIGLVSSRVLVPVMAKVCASVRLNVLAAEAVAAAVVLDASLLVVASSPQPVDACDRLGVELTISSI